MSAASRSSGSGRPFSFRGASWLALAAVVGAVAIAGWWALGARTSGPGRPPVVVLGWDGADPRVVEDLFAAGLMPNLRALRARGAGGRLRSHAPYLSPLLWTSIATGRRPEQHGVLDFVEPGADGTLRPIGSGCRRGKTLWQMASERGRRIAVVNWWATEPAETPGWMVSDRAVRDGRDAESSAMAAELFDRLVRGQVSVGKPDVRDEQLLSFLVETARTHRMLQSRLTQGHADLVMAYSGLPDQAAHLFLAEMPPRRAGIDEASFRRYGGVVHGAYLLLDAMLGELLRTLPADATVLVLSDHGFLYGSERERARAEEDPLTDRLHTPDGIWVAAGPGVRPGADATLDLHDVAPTLLALLGLPAGKDLAGRPSPVVLSEPPPAPIASWETEAIAGPPPLLEGRGCGGAETGSGEALEKLRALGYLGGEDGGDAAVQPLANYARSLLDAGAAQAAAQAFAQALARRPDDPGLGFLWLGALLAQAPADAVAVENAVRRFLRDRDGRARPEFAFVLIELLLGSGRAAEARTLAGEVAGSGIEGALAAWLAAAWEGEREAALGHARRAAALDPARAIDTLMGLGETFPGRELDLEATIAALAAGIPLDEVLRAPVSALTANPEPALARAGRGALWQRRARAYAEAPPPRR